MASFRILVVDDEKLIRWSLRQRLEAAGYRVSEADSGAGALRRYNRDVDLVLLDYRLPDTDGLAVLRKIRQSRGRAPVILMTAYISPETIREARADGAFEVVPKPFDYEEILQIVAQALDADAAPPSG